MPCNVITLPAGSFAVVCGRKPGPQACAVCGTPSTKLCDFPVGDTSKPSRTCDQPLCDKCAIHRGFDVDYCPAHAEATAPGASVAPSKLVFGDPASKTRVAQFERDILAATNSWGRTPEHRMRELYGDEAYEEAQRRIEMRVAR